MSTKYATLDLSLLQKKKSKIISSKEALKDVTPVLWSKEVLMGEKKAIVTTKRG